MNNFTDLLIILTIVLVLGIVFGYKVAGEIINQYKLYD